MAATNWARWLGKEAARLVHGHSRTFKLKDREQDRAEALHATTGNALPPHRYGRKISRKDQSHG